MFVFDLILYAVVLCLVIEVYNMKKHQNITTYGINFEVRGDTLFIESDSIKHIRIKNGIKTVGDNGWVRRLITND